MEIEYAQIKNGRVVGRSILRDRETERPELVQLEGRADAADAQLGALYDAEEDRFTAPDPAEPEPVKVTRAEWMDLWTQSELVAWELFPDGAGAQESAEHRVFDRYFTAQTRVNLESPRVAQFLAWCVDKGLLTQERADEISGGVTQ